VLGQQWRLNGTSRTVVGVMPPRFLWRGADVYLPVVYHRGQTIDDVRIVHLLGRLKPGATKAQAETDLRPVIQAMRDRQPQTGQAGFRIQLLSFKETFRSPLRSALWLLLGAVALLLLIACGNVSNLLLARTSTRAREIAVRTSLGASRGRVIRQLLTESVVLAAAGGLLGVAIAYGSLEALLLIIPPDMIPAESAITLNRQVLVFTLAVSMLSAIVFGLAPAMQMAKTGIMSTLREAGRGLAGGVRQARLRSALIVFEVALSVVLLLAASLMIRTVMRMQQVALGFDPDRILSMRIPLAPQRYPKPEDRARFLSALVERTRALPGVTDVSATGTQPFQPFPSRSAIDIPGRPFDPTRIVSVTEADDRFMPITGTLLLRGRTITGSDVTAVRQVGVINETLARTWFGTSDPIGLTAHLKYLQRAPLNLTDDGIEIIGVMKDAPNLNLDQPLLPQILVPYTLNGNNMFLFVRTTLPPRQLDRTVRAQVYAIDKDQPVTEVQALDTLIDQWSFSAPRFNVVLFAIFGTLGLLLATIGVYGVISYSVASQRQEIGVRMALGAQRSNILRMIMTMGLKLVVAGAIVGCLAAYAASTLLASQLHGVSPHDPVAFAGVIAVLLFVGAQACLWPARRATRVDPMVALRDE
jgi:predicted permease